MSTLDDQVAVVTGAGSGIGRGISLRLARDGAAVVVVDVDPGAADETVGMIEAAGGRALAARPTWPTSTRSKRPSTGATNTSAGSTSPSPTPACSAPGPYATRHRTTSRGQVDVNMTASSSP